LLQMWLPRR